MKSLEYIGICTFLYENGAKQVLRITNLQGSKFNIMQNMKNLQVDLGAISFDLNI